MNYKEIVEVYRDDSDKIFAGRVLDKGIQTAKQQRVVLTPFYDPHQQKVAEDVLRKVADITFYAFGGYCGAERVRIAIMPPFYKQETVDMEIEYLKLTGNFKFVSLSHRDVLGAFLSLGIKRESLGDILVSEDDGVRLIVTKEVVPFIISNLTQVHQATVKAEIIKSEEFKTPPKRVKEIKGTVASLRLDAVSSLGYSASRTKMASVIKAEHVKVNWQPVKNPALSVKEGDVISVAGKGRIEINNVGGESRKGRLRITLKKYI